MFKHHLSAILKGILLLTVSIIVGALLMIAVYAIPADAVRENVRASMDTLNSEGLRYAVIPGYSSSRLDNFADAIMLGNMIIAPSPSLVENAMTNSRFTGGQPISALNSYLEGDESVGFETYSRYWHGYLVILKPLFLFINYNSVRVLNMTAQLALVLSIAALLGKRRLGRYVIPLFAAYMSLCPIALMCSLQYSSVFYIAFLSMLCMLLLHEHLVQMGYGLFFLLIGILTSFFDFLTYPIITVGLPLALFCVLMQHGKTPVRPATLICLGAAWAFGYAGMWSGKWLAASLLTGHNSFEEAGSSILYRSGAHTDEGEPISIFTGLECNLQQLFNPLFALVFLGVIALCVLLLLRRGLKLRLLPRYGLPYLLIALLPSAWLIATCNHAVSHTFYTYRSLSVAVFAIPCLLLSIAGNGHSLRPPQ